MLGKVTSDQDRKRLGIYYTPAEVAKTLVDWALRSPNDTVLEPSFGGCNFLRASHARLQALGCCDPLRQICGTDIDRRALDSLAQAFGMVDIQRRFLLTDFLVVDNSAFAVREFDVVVGNPPYVSHHAMSHEQKTHAWNLAKKHRWPLRKTASLWAYFLLHSLNFCKPGARLAFVLPPAFLLADYSATIRSLVDSSFEKVTLTDLHQPIFRDQGTNERSILLFAEGYRDSQYATAFARPQSRSLRRVEVLSDSATTAFATLTLNSTTLGSCANFRIGTVTGANKLFILSAQTAEDMSFRDDFLLPLLARIPKRHGLDYSEEDHVAAVVAGDRCYLLQPPSKPLAKQTPCIRNYFTTYPAAAVHRNRTFQKRPLWFRIDDVDDPDAFLSYMHHHAPTLLLNRTRAVCSNNIHRLWWKSHITDRDRKLIAISFLSTFTQLSAELEGRTYGGGVLKHELTEARQIRVLVPQGLSESAVDETYATVDRNLRQGRRDAAIAAADELVIRRSPTTTHLDIAALSAALARLRAIRSTNRE